MKELKLSYKQIEAQHSNSWQSFLNQKLRDAGFNLRMPIIREQSFDSCHMIWRQEDYNGD
jgi:hypothetical protein